MLINCHLKKICNKSPEKKKEAVLRANVSNCDVWFLLSLHCALHCVMVITRPIVRLHGLIRPHKWNFLAAFQAVLKATWVLHMFFHLFLEASIQKSGRSPEHGDQRGVNGVSVVDVHVVPAALGGEVVEAQPEHRVRTERQETNNTNMRQKHSWCSFTRK